MLENLDTESGISDLNNYLASRSYINNYTPSLQDVSVSKQIDIRMLDANKFPHTLRWYRQITSFPLFVTQRWPAGASDVVKEAKEEKTKVSDKKKVEDEQEEAGDGFDPFADSEPAKEVDSDDERQQRIDKIAAEKIKKDIEAGKKPVVTKSSIIFEVKPYDSDTNMDTLKKEVLGIKSNGVTWGDGQFKPIAYGLKKLVIMATLIDDLVDVDALKESIEGIMVNGESVVQSADILTWNKI